MDEEDKAKQELIESFRRSRMIAEARPARAPRWQLEPQTRAWIIGVTIAVLIVIPVAAIVIYPRFGPVDTMTAFCTDEGVGEYSAAYALLSKRAQQQESLDAFTQASKSANLVTCSANHGIPLILGGTQASLDANYQFANGLGSDGSMSFVRENGQWRVDAMSPDLFHLSS